MTVLQSEFSPDVIDKLRNYVYRLIDPRNGETFYVGKGTGNRVFAHACGKENIEGDELDNRLRRIREIRVAGMEVGHVIHRHGLDEDTALHVEAALIDAYSGLTNIVGGHGGSDFGVMHVAEIAKRYAAKPADFKHRALLVAVSRTASERSLYDATRYAWRIDPKRAAKADVVLATIKGMVCGAFVAASWLEATPEHFPGLAGENGVLGRFGFVGTEAPAEVQQLYVGKRIPDEYRKRGAANPIRYTWTE